MSRSRKKYAGGTNVCCKSQKKGKKYNHHKFRRLQFLIIKRLLRNRDSEELFPQDLRELTNSWDLGGDGKRVYTFDKSLKDYKLWIRK